MGFIISMGLLQNIRNGRVRQSRRRPLQRDVFHTISWIVKTYGLSEDFLKLPDNDKDYISQKRIELTDVKLKKAFEPPPFSLASPELYELATILIGQFDNPYLQFARSPEEILLSARLYEANPCLKSQDLLRYDFETLLFCQHAKKEVADLERWLGNINGSDQSFLQERMKQLRAFIAKVENREPQPE